MDKWYRVKCSKCGAIFTSLRLGNVVGFFDLSDEVKYETDVVTTAEYRGIKRLILCSDCAGDSFDQTKFCTTPDVFATMVKTAGLI